MTDPKPAGGTNGGGGGSPPLKSEDALKEKLTKKKIENKLKKRESKGSGMGEEGAKGGGDDGKKSDSKDSASGDPQKRDACSIPGGVLPERRRRKRRKGRGGGRRDLPPGPPVDSRDFYRGPPPEYRGDYYGRGPPRDYFDDRRGPPRGGGRRDDRAHGGRHGGPPPPRGRPPVRGDGYGREPPRGGGGGRSRSYSPSSRSSGSRSRSRSRSRSGSRSYSSRSRSGSRSYSRSASRSYSRSPSRGGSKSDKKRSASGSRSQGRRRRSPSPDDDADDSTKDQRTVFVSQIVLRATEDDVARYFHRSVGTRVREVVMLGKDHRTGRHKGCAYVELAKLGDVDKALAASGTTPDFQRFPILVKRTESEKNAMAGGGGSAAFAPPGAAPVQRTADGRRMEACKVYVGSIDRVVTQAQLYALFSQFGPLDKILLQMDVATGASRGFAFLSYRDPKDANLAIQTMSGQMLAGRPLKTGWANQQASAAGVVEVKSTELPADASEKIQRANATMQQLTGAGLTAQQALVDATAQQVLLAAGAAPAGVASAADAALDAALGVPTTAAAASAQPATLAAPVAAAAAAPAVDAKVVGRSDNPTPHILVHNMFCKEEETEPGWENDIKLDFEEECAQYGKIASVLVMSKDPGGKIYASFDSVDGAASCAKNLAGRWFDKRQLRVEFVDSVPDPS